MGQVREVFNSGRTRSVEWRKTQLKALVKMMDTEEERFCEALKKDLGKVCVWNRNPTCVKPNKMSLTLIKYFVVKMLS